jgi:putative redox protein
MVRMKGRYLGNKKIEILHEPSGVTICTAAPKDNNGDGSSFSPTDLASASLAACMLTLMGIYAERTNIDLTDAQFSVNKIMTDNPRRIAELPVTFHLPRQLPQDERMKLERAAQSCPVRHSLHPEIKVSVEFLYDID